MRDEESRKRALAAANSEDWWDKHSDHLLWFIVIGSLLASIGHIGSTLGWWWAVWGWIVG